MRIVLSLERFCGRAHAPAEIAETATRIAGLSGQQRRVFEQVIAGESNKTIAFDLGLSEKTVETHRARVMKKLQARSLAELVRIAARGGVHSDDGPFPDAEPPHSKSA